MALMPLTRIVAGAFGGLYALAGLGGFLVTGLTRIASLAVFPLSPAGNAVHLAIGVLGVAAYFAATALNRNFCQVAGGILGLLSIAGVVAPTGFGILPLGGFDIVLHAASALVLMYVGFAATRGPGQT